MGHDYIDYGERGIRLRDSDIWELRHFLQQEASESNPSDLGIDEPTLQRLCKHLSGWEWCGPGVVRGTDLSEFVQEQAQRRQALVRLFQRTITRLERFGGTIPLDYLQQHLDNGCLIEYIGPLHTERLVTALRSLIELVETFEPKHR
jgi:hypothetical protein